MYWDSIFRQAPHIQNHDAEAVLTSLYILQLGHSCEAYGQKAVKMPKLPRLLF